MGGVIFNGARVALAGALVLALGTGCARPPPHRSDALKRSRALLESASLLESELHAQNAELDLYSELTARREHATEVTCSVAQSHIREIQRLSEAQKRKRERSMRSRKVALLGQRNPNSPWR